MEKIKRSTLFIPFLILGILLALTLSCNKDDTLQEETISDIDGNIYHTIIIGTQVWMKENLKTTKFNDSTDIPLVIGNQEWHDLTTPGYSWYKNDESTYKTTYGALYNWYTVNTSNLCPIGWHIPTNDEWKTLTDYLGGKSIAGGKLKENGINHWKSTNEGANNSSGFTALPGGYRAYYFDFFGIGEKGYWWSSTEYTLYEAYCHYITHDLDFVIGYSEDKRMGFSVRCVKD